MADAQQPEEELDALVIGAGVTGLYQLHCLLQIGMKARIYDAAGGVGGTWYWNRYPGCRFDSESYTYAYSFSDELLQEWDWKEHFSGQVETERYLNYVADKFDLRPHIQLNARVRSAVWSEDASRWDVESEDGRRVRTRFLLGAVGILSATHMPDFPGIDAFKGKSIHTSRWPQQPVDFSGKRVGVIGTGATAVQLIPEVAKECEHLTVFQRSPNYCSPLRNSLIDEKRQNELKASYPEIFAKCRANFAGFMHERDPRSALEVTPEEREAHFEKIWAEPGFAKWLCNFEDVLHDPEAAELYSEFVRNKIRERVDDPVVAEKLCPQDHLYGSKRPPLETYYYEAYNRDNVLLVDVREAPIECITPTGVKTQDGDYDLDILIYATGFDAVTGEITSIDIRGVDGLSIAESWAEGPRTAMGLLASGFPNFFIENGAVFSNFPRTSELVAEFVTACICHMRDKGYNRIEATPEAEENWAAKNNIFIQELKILLSAPGWWSGDNVPGKATGFLFFAGGNVAYREECEKMAASDYAEFDFR